MKEDFTDFIEVSGLLNYDPETIAKIYKKKSSKTAKKTLANTHTYFCLYLLRGMG